MPWGRGLGSCALIGLQVFSCVVMVYFTKQTSRKLVTRELVLGTPPAALHSTHRSFKYQGESHHKLTHKHTNTHAYTFSMLNTLYGFSLHCPLCLSCLIFVPSHCFKATSHAALCVISICRLSCTFSIRSFSPFFHVVVNNVCIILWPRGAVGVDRSLLSTHKDSKHSLRLVPPGQK